LPLTATLALEAVPAEQSVIRADAGGRIGAAFVKRGSPGPERRPAGEAALVRAAQAGSEQALASLFDAHWPRAHRAAYLIVRDAAAAEDIAQEALLAAIRALHRFDRRRPFGPWLHRIVVNRAIDWSRARALRREVSEDRLPEAPDPGARRRPESLSGEMTGALAGLSPEGRAVVVLRYLLGYTPGEISRLLEVPRGTVNSRLRRSLDQLAGQLEEARE
jgi:RNA polymerase sigma-70 factor (ECF subfamily)